MPPLLNQQTVKTFAVPWADFVTLEGFRCRLKTSSHPTLEAGVAWR